MYFYSSIMCSYRHPLIFMPKVHILVQFSRSVKKFIFHFSSVAQSCPTLCDPMSYNTPALPVHHQLPEPTQTHVH